MSSAHFELLYHENSSILVFWHVRVWKFLALWNFCCRNMSAINDNRRWK